jgi:membrane protein DedA with SNARE-associated domain
VHFQQLLKDYLQFHGYWVLFAGTFLEGEAILIIAGFLAFQGHLNMIGVILTSWAGSFLGDQCYFYLGRLKAGNLPRCFHPIAGKFREALHLIKKYGSLVAFISRYTYGLRIVLPIILGFTGLAPRTFLWINLLSALSWALVFSLSGYLFGKSASLVLDNAGKYELHLMLALAGIIMIAWCFHAYHAFTHNMPARRRLARMRARRKARKNTT